MNVRKTIFAVGGIGIILILLAIRLGWFNGAQKQDHSTPEKTPQTAAKPAARPQSVPKSGNTVPAVKAPTKPQTPAVSPAAAAGEKELLGSGDPFNYAVSGTGAYTPLSGSKNVGVITVKGIIRIDGEAPRAILHLKDSGRVHYVSKNSVVRVNTGTKKGTSPAEAYIVVKDIRDDEVELIQLERPDKVIIIR